MRGPIRPGMGLGTAAVHAGEPRPKPAHALTTPIIQTATYTFADTQELKDHFQGKVERVAYGRSGNPTQRIAEDKLAALEGAEATRGGAGRWRQLNERQRPGRPIASIGR